MLTCSSCHCCCLLLFLCVFAEELMKFGTGVKRKAHGMYGLSYKSADDERPMKAAVKIKFDD